MIGDPKRREQANKSVVNLEDQHSNSKPSFQWEGNVWRIWEKRTSTRTCPRPERSKFQVKTFCFNKQETYKGHRRREPAKNYTLNPEDRTFKLKIKTFNSKSIPQDGDQIKKLTFVHSDKYWRLYTNSLISIEILFVHIFCDYTIYK